MTEPNDSELNDAFPPESDDKTISASMEIPEEVSEVVSQDGGSNSTNEVMDLIASVEDQLEKMKSAQVNRSHEIESLESRRADLARREKEIACESERLGTLELDLETRSLSLIDHEAACAERAVSMEVMRTALDADAEDMLRRERDLADIQERSSCERNEIVLEQGRLAGERDELERARVEFDVEADRLKAELVSAHQAIAETESIRAALEDQADRLHARHDQMSSSMEESNARAESFRSEVESLKSGSIELVSELQSAADAIKRLEADRVEIDDELNNCRADLERSNESARSAIEERDEIKANLELAMDRLQALAQAVSEQAAELDEGAVAISRCRELEERMETLSRELEEAHDRLDRDARASETDDSESLARAEEELHRLRTELESCVTLVDHESAVQNLTQRLQEAEGASFSGTDEGLLERLDEARCEIDTLETHARSCEQRLTEKEGEFAELQMRYKELESTDVKNTDVVSDATLLRDQARRLASFATHLQLRRIRLRRMRGLLADQADPTNEGTGTTLESERIIRVQQEDMNRRRHEMSELESRMLRRWACHSTAGTVVKISMLLVLIACASWFGTRWFAPGAVSSTALVRAHPVMGGGLDDSTGAAWNEWHKALLSDDLFVKAAFNRFQGASFGGAYSAEVASEMLGSNMVVTEVAPGTLQIRLHGSSPLETQQLLESVVATLSSESQRQLARRGDGARVEVLNTDGRLVVNDPVPVTSGQFQTAGFAFGGSVVVLGLLGGGVYARLRRSRRIFDENIGIDSSSIE